MRDWLAGWFERWLLASWHCSHPLCPKRKENAVQILKSTVKQQSLPAKNFHEIHGTNCLLLCQTLSSKHAPHLAVYTVLICHKFCSRRDDFKLRANGRNNSWHCWANNVGSCPRPCGRWRANGRNNSWHCWANNVGSCPVRVGGGVQTDSRIPNNTQ